MHSSVEETDRTILARIEQIEPFAIAAAALIATLALIAGLLPPSAHYLAVAAEMRPPTAVAMLFVTLALAMSVKGMPPFAQTLSTGIALGLVATPCWGFLALSGLLPVPHERPELLPPAASMFMSLMGFAALLWNRQSRGVRALIADAGAVVASIGLLFMVGGFVFNGLEMTGAGGVPLQSPPTILAVFLVTFVLVARRAATGGPLSFLISDGIGSRIARMVLPAVALMPFAVFEALSALQYVGVPIALTRAVVAPLVAAISIAVVVWMGRRANHIECQLRRQSTTDQLTGLLNQRGFEDAAANLDRTTFRGTGGMIAFFFDLDNLKRANDLLGHTAGSQVIQRFADLLSVTFRKGDVIGRVGGDEFVVLAPAPAETAEDILRRFARVVETLNETEFMPVPISYSVGYAQLAPGDIGDLEDLIAEADTRMYAEKSRKRAA